MEVLADVVVAAVVGWAFVFGMTVAQPDDAWESCDWLLKSVVVVGADAGDVGGDGCGGAVVAAVVVDGGGGGGCG